MDWKNKMKQLIKKLGHNSPIFFELVFDILAFIVSYIIHYYLRFESGLFESDIHPSFLDVVITGLILTIYWLLAFFFNGLYRNWLVRSSFEESYAVIKTTFFFNFILFFLVFLDSSGRPRLLFLIYFVVLTFFVLLGRFTARKLQQYLRSRKIIQIPVVILGSKNEVLDLLKKVNQNLVWGYSAQAVILIDSNVDNSEFSVLVYKMEQLDEVIKEIRPSELFIAMKNQPHELVLEIANKCAENHIVVKIVPDLYDVLTGLVRTIPQYSIPLIEISTQLLQPWEVVLKRLMDIIVSSLALILGLPLWILIAILIKLDSKGQIFYKQERVGKNGKIFTLYKFRSMYVDAEKYGPQITKLNDPRVTRVGYFLRRTHLDEVPQFWNVLKGEMSLVGPRPDRTYFIEKYCKIQPLFKRRLVVRPGITGWNQVNSPIFDGTIEDINNKLKDDFYYIENMSIKLDIEILLRTLYLVIRGKGQA